MLPHYDSTTAYYESRRKAMLSVVLDAIRRQPNGLLPFETVRASLNVRGQVALGYQIVPLQNIIGSEGRYSDFDRRFLPLSQALEERWRNVERAMVQARDLPPIDLYKISDIYFVRDGNHRVSVARQRGLSEIDAYVTELLVDVPLTPDLSIRTLLFAEEYSDFLEWTNLHALRPDQRIEFSELGGYLDLVRHINAHRYTLGQQQGRAIERDEAVAGWYDSVYMPVVRVIREQRALRRFPSRTEADLYRWIMDHRDALGEDLGTPTDLDHSSRVFAATLGRASWTDMVAALLRGMLGQGGAR